METSTSHPPGYPELIRTFLRISLLGFGGPNAHLALMLDEVVDRKKWITREHFMHLVAVTNLLPGPNSSEVAIHIGYTQRGWRGALATGLTFLLPTFLLVTLFSALYFRYGSLPSVEGVFWGLKPAILAIILAAGWRLGKTALGLPERPAFTLLLLAVAGVLTSVFFGGFEVPVMALGGGLAWIVFRDGSPSRAFQESGQATGQRPNGTKLKTHSFSVLLTSTPFAAGLLSALGVYPAILVLTVGAGAVLFGGGYMLVALIEPFVVNGLGWVTADQFLDGIALTQAVPGPIVTLVAFVGFGAGGVLGALVATFGIYLPSFSAVLLAAPHLERWRHAEGVRAALKGVNAVVAGAILGVGLTLLPPALPDRWAALLFFLGLAVLIRFRVQAVWIVGAGLGAGLIHIFLGG